MYTTPMRAPCVLLCTCAQAAAHRTQLAELATGWPQTWHMRALASSLCAPMRPRPPRRQTQCWRPHARGGPAAMG
jgi:hypothetical protein